MHLFCDINTIFSVVVHATTKYHNDDAYCCGVLASQPAITTSELLRQRSNLRPVTRHTDSSDDVDDTLPASLQSSTTDEHLRLLREALERIKKSSGTDTDDDDKTSNDEDDDFED